jgi:serine protease inhibitor
MKYHLCLLIYLGLCQLPVFGQSEAEFQSIVRKHNAFAFNFYTELEKSNSTENIAFSPFSLASAFAIAYQGSNSNTKTEIQKAFKFEENAPNFHQNMGQLSQALNQNQKEGYKIQIHNTLFLHKGYVIRDDFRQTVENQYKAGIELVDFEAGAITQKRINDWGTEKSKGMINEILKDYNASLKMLLANLLFFEAEWVKEFKPEKTKLDTFHLSNNRVGLIPYMHGTQPVYYQDTAEWLMLGLPYTGLENGSMLILMPKTEVNEANMAGNIPEEFKKFINEQATVDTWNSIPEADIALPKMTIDFSLLPKTILSKMGVNDAFSSSKADFSRLTDNSSGLFITTLEHHCKLILDEKGTRAAASTVVGFAERSLREPRLHFKIDRPFLFVIRDEQSKCILLMGKVLMPKEK